MKCGKKSKANDAKSGAEEAKPSVAETRHLKSDGLRLSMPTNRDSLWIEGDGCQVKLQTNYGLVRMSGDGGRIRIGKNLGSIEYIGNGGQLLLGPDSDLEGVSYRGDGGSIEIGKCADKPKQSPSPSSGDVTVRRFYLQNGKLVTSSPRAREAPKVELTCGEGRPANIHVDGFKGRSLSIQPGKIVYG